MNSSGYDRCLIARTPRLALRARYCGHVYCYNELKEIGGAGFGAAARFHT